MINIDLELVKKEALKHVFIPNMWPNICLIVNSHIAQEFNRIFEERYSTKTMGFGEEGFGNRWCGHVMVPNQSLFIDNKKFSITGIMLDQSGKFYYQVFDGKSIYYAKEK